jgi:DNA-binding NarL/FixJ family response regulator
VVDIVLADDHQVIRKGLIALLSSEPNYHIVAEAAGGMEAINTVMQNRPDILILDLMLPDISGLEVIRQLSKENIETAIIILSMHSDKAYVQEALQYGAKGYILKDSPPEEILKAIQAVLNHKYYLSPPLAKMGILS